jgi:soluble cytochrome b562
MASKSSIDALTKTREALEEIQKQMRPFLRDLMGENAEQDDEIDEEEEKIKTAQASMAIALAMGTLRYMGARLRGLDQGRKQDDPLRKELNNMRKIMRDLQKKIVESKEKAATKRKANDYGDNSTKQSTPTKHSAEEPASKKRRK